MDDPTLSLIITSASAVCFVLSAWATFWIWRARRGGWMRLASTYPTPKRRDSNARRRQSVTLMPSGIGYPAVMTFRLTVDGLYARPGLVVRFGHDPVLIPWDDIEIFAVDNTPAHRLYDLKFARLPQVRMRVGAEVATLIRRAADNSHYFQEQAAPIAARAKAKPAVAVSAPAEPVLSHQSVA
ncbi:MAG: hypothetical protein QM754_03615 [Tepidisphaeraceae bacterium]